MDNEESVLKEGCQMLVLFIGMILVIYSGTIYNTLKSWAEYDPEESAKEHVAHCIDITKMNQYDEYCGYITDLPCWDIVRQSVSQADFQYSIDVLWYNRKDNICCRGGDEIMLQVEFSTGAVVRIVSYEGYLEECKVVESTEGNHLPTTSP